MAVFSKRTIAFFPQQSLILFSDCLKFGTVTDLKCRFRIAAGLATKNSSSFAVVRNLQQAGAGLTCSQVRISESSLTPPPKKIPLSHSVLTKKLIHFIHLFQGREYLLYTTQMTRDKVESAIDFFLDTIGQPVFKPWELSDNAVRY
jgi:hypothetical protein